MAKGHKSSNEMEFQGQAVHWLNTYIANHPSLGLETTTQEKPRQTQHTAHNHAYPPVDELQRPGIEWKSHNITAVVSRPALGLPTSRRDL